MTYAIPVFTVEFGCEIGGSMYCATRRTAGVPVTELPARPFPGSPTPPRCVLRRSASERAISDHRADTVALLEAAAIALGVASLGAERLGLARSTAAALRQCGHDPVAATRYARQFHRTLVMACPNAHMLELLELHAAGARPTPTLIEVRSDELGRVIDEHEAILDMIAAGAGPADVERCLRQHAGHSRLCAAV